MEKPWHHALHQRAYFQIIGLSGVPNAGDKVMIANDETEAR
jgi:hypothetical protein